MTQLQKIIKYLAIAFAIFLIVSIFSGIYYTVDTVLGFTEEPGITEDYSVSEPEGQVKTLKLELARVTLKICTGERFEIKTNSNRLSIRQDGEALKITEKKHSLFAGKTGELILVVPEDHSFSQVEIDGAAGMIEIDRLHTDSFDLDQGAGEIIIHELIAEHGADIDGGAGKITIGGGKIANLDLDMGVGKLELTAAVIGSSKMDCGVGKAELTLLGTEADYKLRLDKGLGSATLNGESMQDGVFYGDGSNRLLMDGGVGSISIRFQEVS